MTCVHDINVGAQVCGLHWSENVNEIVSAHGFQTNVIQVWKASTMECIGTIPGSTTRVVYMTASPDGQCIATGSGRMGFFLFCESLLKAMRVFDFSRSFLLRRRLDDPFRILLESI